MKYNFDVYKKEHLRYSWLSGNYTDKQLKEKYYEQYKEFCISHNLEFEKTNEGRILKEGI